VTRKTDDSYKSKLSSDLATLMNYSSEERDVGRDAADVRNDLLVVTATCRSANQELHETSVCTPDVPNEVLGEVVGGLLEQMRLAGMDLLQHEISISFGRAKNLG
jgi:hypothetical protein